MDLRFTLRAALPVQAAALQACGSRPVDPEPDRCPPVCPPVDTLEGRWSAAAPTSVALAAMGVAALDGKIYVFGGSDGSTEYFFTHVYDPVADRWTTAASMPTAREHTVAVAMGSTIYVVGGRSAAGRNTGAAEAYTPATDSWRTLALGPSTSGHAAAAMGAKLYVFGGEAVGGVAFAAAREYDPQANRWRAVAPLPTARHGFGAAGPGSVIQVIGGSDEAGTQNLAFRLP